MIRRLLAESELVHDAAAPARRARMRSPRLIDCLKHCAVLLLACVLTCAPARAEVETVTHIHNDAFGNPVLATDASGNVVWRESYRPYGERLKNEPASAANKQWFAGKPQDTETGLSYFGARYYDPVLGRFMGIDPQGFEEKNPQSFNRYAYGNNNPYRFIDPDGKAPFLIFLAPAIASAGGAVIAGGLNAAIQLGTTGTVQWGGLGGVFDAAGDGAMFGLLGAGSVANRGAAQSSGAISTTVPDAAVVVRGGTKELPPPGQVFSGAAGKSLEDAAQGVPHGQIRATTAEQIRSTGGSVQQAPERTRSGAMNEKHVNVCLGGGACPFGPVQSNPVPKVDRVQ